MGLFRRLRRVTTGAVRQRVKRVFSREPSIDEADLEEPPQARAQRPRPAPAASVEPVESPPTTPAPNTEGPSETVQVVDGTSGRRSL